MRKKSISLLILSAVLFTSVTSKVSYADTLSNKENENTAVVESTVNSGAKSDSNLVVEEEKTVENSYLNFKNIWGGNSLKILFNQDTMKIEAIRESGNFGHSNNNFTFKLINKKTGEAKLSEVADSIYVKNFSDKINDKAFNYGDIIALNINKSSGLKSPALNSNGKVSGTNCVGNTEYFEITKSGIVKYNPSIDVNPLQILGEGTVVEANVSGKTNPGNKVCVSVDGNKFYEYADINGNFSVKVNYQNGITANTPITVGFGEFNIPIHAELLNKENMKEETVTGYKYTLNMDLNKLTTPFNSEIYYAKTLLNEEGQKAWDLAYRTLLKYNNVDNKYPRDSQGNTIVTIDYASKGIHINSDEAQKIQKYLVRNCPRMFLLKDWGASPITKDGQVVGQKFFIGNGAQNGNDYEKQLLQTEKSVSDILSKIEPNMSVYQIIQTIQSNYEGMVRYVNSGACGDMRGTFIAHKAICGGYSKGYEYLLQRVGIENIWVNGHAGGPHAWNFTNLYGNWYLSDTTWGGQNWYLNGANSPFTANHKVYNTYNIMPKLAEESISWNIGDRNQNKVNLIGVVNYKDNGDGTITITYNDKNKVNESLKLNSSLNNWKAVDMKNDGNGIWSITLPTNGQASGLNFFFTVNNKYSTTGNVIENNLKTELLPNGMNNIII